MFKGKDVIVKLSEEASEVYSELNKIAGEEKIKSVMDIFNHKDYDKVFGYKH